MELTSSPERREFEKYGIGNVKKCDFRIKVGKSKHEKYKYVQKIYRNIFDLSKEIHLIF